MLFEGRFSTPPGRKAPPSPCTGEAERGGGLHGVKTRGKSALRELYNPFGSQGDPPPLAQGRQREGEQGRLKKRGTGETERVPVTGDPSTALGMTPLKTRLSF